MGLPEVLYVRYFNMKIKLVSDNITRVSLLKDQSLSVSNFLNKDCDFYLLSLRGMAIGIVGSIILHLTQILKTGLIRNWLI